MKFNQRSKVFGKWPFNNLIYSILIVHVLLGLSVQTVHVPIVCNTTEIGPGNILDLNKIKSCEIIEGSISIIRLNMHELKNLTKLKTSIREITGYLLIYQVHGLKSLELIFPELTVIRGNQLFGKYSLILYENIGLNNIGLKSLVNILNGSIRIENNPTLCFVDTINWIKILSNMTTQHYILKRNKDSAECPTCPELITNRAEFIPCWNLRNLQKVCPDKCEKRACNLKGECCDNLCFSNCPNTANQFCDICAFLKKNDGQCVKTCKNSKMQLFEFNGRRCIPQEKCTNLNLVTFNGMCIDDCPKGYYEKNHKCEPCQNQLCKKVCNGKFIRTKNDLKSLQSCTKINGSLTIELNERQGKIINELEMYLSDIEEIDGYLKIFKSPEIVSLYFFRNLREIKGNELFDGRYSLYVIENFHLEQLWMPNQTIKISNGKIFFHFNPKLCYETIKQLQPNVVNNEIFSIEDVSNHTNGVRVVCQPHIMNLNVVVEELNSTAVRIKIEPISFDDKRLHLGYLFYYIEAPQQNVTMYDGRHGCGHDNWKLDIDTSKNVRHIIKNLKPYTQYAYFVKTFTIATTHIKQDAFSEINYFQTLPDIPGPVRRFHTYALNESAIALHWWPPSNPLGKLKAYIINAVPLSNMTSVDKSIVNSQKESKKNYAKNTTEPSCICNTENAKLRGPSPQEDELYDQETVMFEDSLMDFVFIPVQLKTNKIQMNNLTINHNVSIADNVTENSENVLNNILENTTKNLQILNNGNIVNTTGITEATNTDNDQITSSSDYIKKLRFEQLLEQSKNEMDTGTKDFPINIDYKKYLCDNIKEFPFDTKFILIKNIDKCWINYYRGHVINAKYHSFILKNLLADTLYNITIRVCNENVAKCSIETGIESRTLSSSIQSNVL